MAAFRTLDHCGSIRAEHPITTGVRWLASLLCISCLIVTKVAAEEYGRTDRWVIESAPEGVEEDPFSCSVAPIFGVQRFDIHVLKKTGEGLLTLETPQEAFAPLLGKPLRVRLIFDQAREMLLPAYLDEMTTQIAVSLPRVEDFLAEFASSRALVIEIELLGAIAVDLTGSRIALSMLRDCQRQYALADARSTGFVTSPAGYFPLASCAGWNGTATHTSGQNTRAATMRGLITEADIREYCERDPGGETTQHGGELSVDQCVEKHFENERDVELLAQADCETGVLTYSYGGQPQQTARFPLAEGTDTSCSSGLPPMLQQFDILCPAR